MFQKVFLCDWTYMVWQAFDRIIKQVGGVLAELLGVLLDGFPKSFQLRLPVGVGNRLCELGRVFLHSIRHRCEHAPQIQCWSRLRRGPAREGQETRVLEGVYGVRCGRWNMAYSRVFE